jgi:multidrug resistance efflux pump
MIAAVALGQTSAGERVVQPPREAHMAHCLISLIEEAQIPAEERGVLMKINVHEGASVRNGEIMAQMDDREAQLRLEVAELALHEAEEKANNEVDIKFYIASAEVALADHLEILEANRKEPGTYTDSDVRRYELQYKKSVAQVDQGKWNKVLEGLGRDVKAAELRAAKMSLTKLQIDAPFDGIVVELFKHAGEWLEPGQPVLRMVRMDRLRVEGFLRSEDLAPSEVLGKPVTIRVQLVRDKVVEFNSRISFVSPLVEGSGEYRVWADVTNQIASGQWLIRPGLLAEMNIDLR